MDEPVIKKHPTEVFGYAFTEKSEKSKDALSRQYCHFIKAECNKPRKSEPHIKVGICSVGYKGSVQKVFRPVIICPNRFIESHVFETIQRLYLQDWGKNLQWIHEVTMGVGGNIDVVAAKMSEDKTKIVDFLCVEFQAAGTTGTPWQAVLDLKKTGKFSSDSYDFGINWANEFMKTMMQQVYKKSKIVQHWKRKILFVVQDVALDYLHDAVDTSAIREAHPDDEIHFITFKMTWTGNAWALQFAKAFSTNVEGINKILGGAHTDKYLTTEDFKKNIYDKGKRDGVF